MNKERYEQLTELANGLDPRACTVELLHNQLISAVREVRHLTQVEQELDNLKLQALRKENELCCIVSRNDLLKMDQERDGLRKQVELLWKQNTAMREALRQCDSLGDDDAAFKEFGIGNFRARLTEVRKVSCTALSNDAGLDYKTPQEMEALKSKCAKLELECAAYRERLEALLQVHKLIDDEEQHQTKETTAVLNSNNAGKSILHECDQLRAQITREIGEYKKIRAAFEASQHDLAEREKQIVELERQRDCYKGQLKISEEGWEFHNKRANELLEKCNQLESRLASHQFTNERGRGPEWEKHLKDLSNELIAASEYPTLSPKHLTRDKVRMAAALLLEMSNTYRCDLVPCELALKEAKVLLENIHFNGGLNPDRNEHIRNVLAYIHTTLKGLEGCQISK